MSCHRSGRLLAGLLALFCCSALAAEPIVHAVQAPAWIERAGGIVALHPGDPLLPGDVIRTGPGGRVQVDLPEGSRIKLGERVEFRAAEMREASDAGGGFFDAAFDVLKGAFRFTTGLAGNERRRDVRFRVGAVTAGIRGTDIWGKSMEDGSDMVLLLEGKVELAVEGRDAMMMEQPLHGVMMTPDGDMQRMDSVPPNMLEQYARETEMNDARAMMMDSGEWQLIVMSLRSRETAERVRDELTSAGYPASVISVEIDGEIRHRVALTHLASAKDASMQGETLYGIAGVRDYWVRRE